MNLVFNFVDSSCNSSSEMLHADVNVFHSVVGVWIVEDEGFLDFLVMISELLHLWSVSLNSGLV